MKQGKKIQIFCCWFYQNKKKDSQQYWLYFKLLDSIDGAVVQDSLLLGSIYGGCDFNWTMARSD